MTTETESEARTENSPGTTGGPGLPQERRVVTEIPGPRSARCTSGAERRSPPVWAACCRSMSPRPAAG